MATLKSEGLCLSIGNVVQYKTLEVDDMYEEFDVDLKINGRHVFDTKILRENYELCSGNIKYLIKTIESVLSGKNKNVEIEFMEPNFQFQIKCLIDINEEKLDTFIYEPKENLYEFVIWITSGNWNGIYSDTAVGGKFVIHERELKQFLEGLIWEYENREIEDYLI